MKNALGSLIVGALVLVAPSAALAAPSVSYTVSEIYSDDIAGVDFDVNCTDLGMNGENYYVAYLFTGSQLWESVDNCGDDDLLYAYEAQATEYDGNIIVVDEYVMQTREDYSPWDYYWLTQSGNDWVAYTYSIDLVNGERP